MPSSSFTKISFLEDLSFISSQLIPICSKSSMALFASLPLARATVISLIPTSLFLTAKIFGHGDLITLSGFYIECLYRQAVSCHVKDIGKPAFCGCFQIIFQ